MDVPWHAITGVVRTSVAFAPIPECETRGVCENQGLAGQALLVRFGR